jgi:lambda family phage portal protein
MGLMRWISGLFARRRKLETRRYAGAEQSDLLMDWILSGVGPNQELRGDQRLLRMRARDLAKNEAVARQFLRLSKANVIGPTGFKLQSQVRFANGNLNQSVNDKIEKQWYRWCKQPTVSGIGTFIDLQQLLLRTVATDGEMLVMIHEGFDNRHAFALQAIDTALIDTDFNRLASGTENAVTLGIEHDAYGRPLAYWLKQYFNGQSYLSEVGYVQNGRRRIDAKRLLHLFIPEQVDQARGASWLNAAVKPLRHLDGYVEAELVAARAGAARLGVVRPNDLFDPGQKTDNMRTSFRAGSLQMLPPGYELDSWSPDHPNEAFPDFTKGVMRQTACALGVSYNALANDLEGVNYSSMRSGLLIERDEWRCLQQWWIASLLQPIYERWLNAALFVGAITGVAGQMPDEDMYEAKWQPRGWAWVDPLKDINAAILAVDNGFTSREAVIGETGGDFEEVVEQLAQENALIDQYGITLQQGNAQSAPPAEDPKDETTSNDNANRYPSSAWRLQ